MAGLLDTLVRKNAEEERAKQIASGSLSTVPPAPPTLGDVQPAPRAISQDDAALANAGPGALGVAAGVEQTSAMLKNAVSAAAQAVSQPELAANVRKSAAANEAEGARISSFSSAPQTLKDALETGDIGNYLIGGVARNVPQLGVMGAGALLTRGRALGVAAPSAAMNAGDVYGEGQGEIDKLVAAGQLDPAREQQMRHQVLVNTGVAAPIMAALDTYGFSKIFGTPALKAGAAKVIADSLPAHVRKALLAEGGTEAVQEYIGLTANKLALERPEAFGLTKDDVWRLADAGVLGAAAGGTFAVPGHIAAPLARAAGQTADAGIDMATAFMRPEEPTPGAAGGDTPPGAGPSAGTRAGDFMRAVVDLDAPAVQKFAQDAFDAAMNNEAVQNAAKQGGDFWSAFSKGKRFARAEAFWDQHAPEVEAGFNQFVAGIGDTAQTGDMKAMFERYKEALARTMPGMPDIDIDRTDVDKAARGAGRKIGDAIAGFNTAAARTPGFVDGIVNGAKKQAAAAAGVMNDAAASAKSAVESGVQSAVDGMENLSGNIREFGERLDAGNRTSQVDPASFATGNTYEPDDSPLDASQAKRVAQSLLTRIRPEQPPGKQSVVMLNDAKAIARTLADHAPGLRNTDFLNMLARGFEGLVNNPALFKSKLNDPQIATTIRMLFNLRPDELAQSLMSDLRAGKEPSTQNDALSYVGDPNYATDAVLASEAKRVEDTGATVDGEVIADTETGEIKDAPERAPVEESNLDPTLPGVRERETFKKMIATPEQKEAAAKGRQKGMQWVIVTETVRDPDTDEVIKQTSRPGQVNLMNMARSQAGERRAVEGATTQQRSDTNFLESVGALFNGWTETNAAGQPVEYRVQPAAQRENGGELTAVPRDGLEGWLRDNSLIGFAKDKDGNAVPRTFGQLEQSGVSSVTVTKNEIPSFAEQAAKFLDKAPTYDEQMAEAKSKEWRERIEKRRAAHASSLAKSAAYFIRKVQGPEERVRDVVAATMDFTDSVPDAAVDEMWDGLETGTIENRDQVLAAIQEASERNDIAPLRGIVPDVYAALSARRSSALMSVQLLSSEMREGWTGSGDAKIDAVLQDHLIEKYEQAPKEDRDITAVDPTEPVPARDVYNDFEEVTRPDGSRTTRSVKTNTISGKAGTLAQDEEGVITEDLAGAYIDHGAAVDRELAGKRKAEAEAKRAAKAKQSVVKATREKARAEPEPASMTNDERADPTRSMSNEELDQQIAEQVAYDKARKEDAVKLMGKLKAAVAEGKTDGFVTNPERIDMLLELLSPAALKRVQRGEDVTTADGRFWRQDQGDHTRLVFSLKVAAPEVAAKGPKGPAPSGRQTEKASAANVSGDLDLTTPEGREVARKAIEEIAGKLHIKFGTEDSYDWQGHVITLAARKDGSLTTAYHEALHAVFKAIATEDKATLYAALNAPHVRKQLRELLKDSPEAIQDMINDSEELAAYAFQFWKTGMLDLNPGAKNWFGKIVELIEKSLAWLKDQPTAEELLNRIADGYYKNGGPNPAEVAFLKSQRAHHALRSVTGMVTRGMLSLYDTLLTPMDDRLRETGIGELHEIARLLYTQVGEEGTQRGLAQAVPAMTKKFLNEFGNIIHGDPAGTIAALRAIASGTDDRTDPRVVKIRSFLNKMHRYMTDAGVKVGYIEDYLPMQWSGDLIADDEEGFIALMSKYRKELKQINEDLTPRLAWQMMSQRNLSRAIPTGDVFDEHGVPTAHHAQERIFSFLSNAEREPYTEPDLIGTMSQYIKQSVKRAEHSRRFGAQNEVLKKLLIDAKDRGATTEQISLVEDYIDAIHGAKFAKMDPSARKIVGAVQTYQNFRVLGLAIFSSVVDPLVLAVRSGEFKEAWGAYKNVVTSILGTRNPQELQQLGEDIGAIEARGIEDAVLGLYGGFEVEGDLKKLNDLFFTYNGMNGLTKSLRVYALGAGQRFIAKHARSNDPRMLRELGLERDDVHFMPDGSLAVRGTQYRELGLDPMEALKIQNALNRFVDESVLHPNAGERPGWGNDPLWGLLFHLKQFIFSFHKTVSKKVAHELESGNPSAALHAAAFIPIMAASGFMREAIQTAGNIPADHGFLYYLGYGAQRSGFMGPSALASDAGHSLMSGMNPLGAVGGPTADQLLDAAGVLAHPERFGDFVEEALPLSSIYRQW